MDAHHSTVPETKASGDEQIVLILVGLVGSGKSTFAEALQKFFPKFRRCNQDDLGNRRRVEELTRRSLQQGLSVCVDRTNFDESQRQHFINIARKFPNASIWALIFETPYETCASRLETRTNHPTIHSLELGLSLLERFSVDFRPPTAREGFDRIKTLSPHPTGNYTKDEIATILNDIRSSSLPQPAAMASESQRLAIVFLVASTVAVASILIAARMYRLRHLENS